jgi:hypothetical protein
VEAGVSFELFLCFFLFFVQIAAGLAPMISPQSTGMARYIFWLSGAGAIISLSAFLYSSHDWVFTVVEIMGQKTVGIGLVILAAVIGVAGLSLFSAPELKHDPRPKGPPAYAGVLTPEPAPTPKIETILSTKTKQASRRMQIGDTGGIINFTAPAGMMVMQFGEDYGLDIEVEGDQLKVSTKVKDKQRKIIAELVRNEWKVAPPPQTWDRNYNQHALEVKDDAGNIVLQVKLLPDRVQIQGEWWNGEHGLRIVNGPTGGGSLIATNDGAMPSSAAPIRPMFNYPSELHFGELKQ